MANSLFLPMEISVKGLEELQAENQRLMAAVSTQPGGGMRNSMALALLQMQRYAIGITHVKTGRLKNSIFVEQEARGNTLVGHIATNVAYAIHEEDRGGDHAFFARTVREEGPRINSIFDSAVRRGGR
jgi:hypothetical protein